MEAQNRKLIEDIRLRIQQAYHAGYQTGLQKGYDLGWHYRQVENSNRSMIKERGKK